MVDAAGTASSAPARRPRAEETAERRRNLLAAAAELAGEGGYEAVQMRDVASRAGVALGTLYRHYSSKDQLLVACLAQQAATLRTRLHQRPPRGDTPAERVADALGRACRALEREPKLTAAMVTAMSAPDEDAAALKVGVLDELTGIIAAALDGPAGDRDPAELAAIVRTLGHVWFSALVFQVGGLAPAGQTAADLGAAARLLLSPCR